MLYLSESANHKRKDNFLKIKYLQSSDTWTDSKLFTAIKKAKGTGILYLMYQQNTFIGKIIIVFFFLQGRSQIIPLLQLLKFCIKVLGNATRKINNQKEEGNLCLFINEQEKNLQKNLTAAIALYANKYKIEIKYNIKYIGRYLIICKISTLKLQNF